LQYVGGYIIIFVLLVIERVSQRWLSVRLGCSDDLVERFQNILTVVINSREAKIVENKEAKVTPGGEVGINPSSGSEEEKKETSAGLEPIKEVPNEDAPEYQQIDYKA